MDGTENPQITESQVRAALDRLLYRASYSKRESPLCHLRLVEEQCLASHFPDSPMKCDLALAEVLTDLITQSYGHHRQVRGFEPPDMNAPFSQVYQQITCDASLDHLELRSWGWLYYRYVRIDLGMTREQFANACGIDERTLRRYGRHGIRRLTERLILLEREARG